MTLDVIDFGRYLRPGYCDGCAEHTNVATVWDRKPASLSWVAPVKPPESTGKPLTLCLPCWRIWRARILERGQNLRPATHGPPTCLREPPDLDALTDYLHDS